MSGIISVLSDLFSISYVQSLVIFIIFAGLAKIVLSVSHLLLKRINPELPRPSDILILERLEYAVAYFFIFIGIKAALVPINFIINIPLHIINSIIIMNVAFIFFNLFSIFLGLLSQRIAKVHYVMLEEEIISLMHNFSILFFTLITCIIILNEWDIALAPLLTSVGIIGIAVGFAMQNSLSNLFGGLSIILDKTFHVGDVIRLESGEIGEVKEIGLRSTKILTFENEYLIVPNDQLSRIKIFNLAKPNKMLRLFIPVQVAYGSDLRKVQKALIESARIKGVDTTKEITARLDRFGESSMDFQLIFYIENYKGKFEMRDTIIRNIYSNFRKHDIIIPFPSRAIYMHKRGKTYK